MEGKSDLRVFVNGNLSNAVSFDYEKRGIWMGRDVRIWGKALVSSLEGML